LEMKLKRLKTLQKSRRVLNEEVAEQDIASVVSRWTGIPVARMLEEEHCFDDAPGETEAAQRLLAVHEQRN